MAGHSKWANIKHRKGAQDAKRGKVFTKMIKEITVAAKISGGDQEANPRLRTAVDKAKAGNMPKDTIERAIKKGTGDLDGVNYEEGTMEGYGPGGVAVLVEILTDNRTRTVADVRHCFTKHNGSLGVDGSVAFLFDRKGLITFNNEVDYDTIFEIALENGAEDVKDEENSYEVLTDPGDFIAVRDALIGGGLESVSAEVTMLPQTQVELDIKKADQMLKLMEKLEDNDDVQNVYTNADFSDEVMAELFG
ncbi:MAG: YebC/PmpR family DNA-binding transcriptional regulator [Thermodesulfobacteriota bacterium]|nr:YebC/PmpR family DNA-binding transcriptional regulator [Thermodesulfobacteriota bacterium]